MGNKDKKKHKHRSRSRSNERHKSNNEKEKNVSQSSSDSDNDSDSSTDRRRHKHKHKSRSRKRSHSQSHDGDSHKSKPFRSVEDLEKMKEENKKHKEMMKALETPEEKRARRLAKKEVKERKRKAQMGWDDEYLGYTNADNPFGDEHLLDTFVWKKKLEKEGKKSLRKIELEQMQKEKMEENKKELEKVKKRRLEREREMEERENERVKLQRDKEAEYFREWEKQEDTFHLQQAKLRSKIRIDDARAKPIDLLAMYISAEEDDISVEMHEPYTYLNGLTITDLEDLLEDIKVYMEMEQGKNVDFWRDITIITEDELMTLRKIDPSSKDYVELGDRREGINQSVHHDVASVFRAKTLNQLQLLEQQIRNKLKGGEGVDVGYWESLLGQLKAHMARTRLRERHQGVLRRKLFKLKQEQGIESQPLFPIIKKENDDDDDDEVRDSRPSTSQPEMGGSHTQTTETVAMPPPSVIPVREKAGSSSAASFSQPQPGTSKSQPSTSQEGENAEEGESILTEDDLLEQSYDDYTAGSYSPRLLRNSELDGDVIVYTPEDDMKRLEYARHHAMNTGKAKEDVEGEFEKRAREGMNDDEAQFSVEMPLEKQTVLWSDKYRPRKPRFFNRVHTGFEWNKYNQTHYDIDNPPPKIVQGYKFNIFYPDLIDKAKTPEYFLTPIEENKDFASLRFHAGPPYEDIAFKIVNREWEYSYKRGFRCQFHNNIFQLWFHFKRYRYRR